jgi:hypothetical protein
MIHTKMYVSTLRDDTSDEDLTALLTASRERNRQADITGMLVVRGRRVMQMLEGEHGAVQHLFARIAADQRHQDVVTVWDSRTLNRRFPEVNRVNPTPLMTCDLRRPPCKGAPMSHDLPDATDQRQPMLSLVYASTAVVGFNGADLAELLALSRAANSADSITGVLLFRNHRFLQLLEGPPHAVRNKMQLIAEDARHQDVLVLLEETVPQRQFPDWTMGYAAASALEGVTVPGHRTTFDDIDFLPDDHDAGPILPALRELIRWFRTSPEHVAHS